MEITDTISTKGLKILWLKPIENDKLLNFIARCKKDNFSYKFIFKNLLFGANMKNDTNIIFITCNRLKDARTVVVHNKDYKFRLNNKFGIFKRHF